MANTHQLNETMPKLATVEDCQAFKRVLEMKAKEEGLTETQWSSLVAAALAQSAGSPIKTT